MTSRPHLPNMFGKHWDDDGSLRWWYLYLVHWCGSPTTYPPSMSHIINFCGIDILIPRFCAYVDPMFVFSNGFVCKQDTPRHGWQKSFSSNCPRHEDPPKEGCLGQFNQHFSWLNPCWIHILQSFWWKKPVYHRMGLTWCFITFPMETCEKWGLQASPIDKAMEIVPSQEIVDDPGWFSRQIFGMIWNQ